VCNRESKWINTFFLKRTFDPKSVSNRNLNYLTVNKIGEKFVQVSVWKEWHIFVAKQQNQADASDLSDTVYEPVICLTLYEPVSDLSDIVHEPVSEILIVYQ
jgi:hypothetical protein